MTTRDNAKRTRALAAAITGLTIAAVILGFVGSWGLALTALASGLVIAALGYFTS
nr:hypothetical protein [Rhodococcus sp. 06-621-2]